MQFNGHKADGGRLPLQACDRSSFRLCTLQRRSFPCCSYDDLARLCCSRNSGPLAWAADDSRRPAAADPEAAGCSPTPELKGRAVVRGREEQASKAGALSEADGLAGHRRAVGPTDPPSAAARERSHPLARCLRD
jgi:hypothetical protein